MNELIAKLRQMDAKMRTIGLGVFLLVIFILDFLFLIRPQFSHYIKLGKDAKELRQNMESANQNMDRAKFLQSEVQDAKKRIYHLQDQLTPKDAISVVLEQISKLASQHRIDIDRMVPDISDPRVLLEKSGKKYVVLPVTLEAQASFHDFGRFIAALENDTLFIRLDSFSVAGDPSGVSKIQVVLKAMMMDGDKIALTPEDANASATALPGVVTANTPKP